MYCKLNLLCNPLWSYEQVEKEDKSLVKLNFQVDERIFQTKKCQIFVWLLKNRRKKNNQIKRRNGICVFCFVLPTVHLQAASLSLVRLLIDLVFSGLITFKRKKKQNHSCACLL